MRTSVGLVLSLLLSIAGCRRQSSPEGDLNTPSKGADARSEGVVVDAGCPHMVEGKCSHEPPPASSGKTGASSGRFGKELGNSPEVPLAEVLANPDRFHEKQVRVDGHVTRACSKKGCWMELAVSSSDNAPRCRVTFENYSFFVPKDSAGSHARLEGTVQVTQVKSEAVQHYEAEGAQFPGKHADGSAREVRLVATGVELERI